MIDINFPFLKFILYLKFKQSKIKMPQDRSSSHKSS